MIEKIELIKNVGKYYNFSTSDDDLSFKKNTIIYARNGYGKTTLTNIIRSYYKNDPEYIMGRKTLGSESLPEVVIKFNKENICFNNNR